MTDDRTARLIALMTKYDLADADVATLIGDVAAATVAIWRCANPARIIPAPKLRLLEAELTLAAAKASA